MRANSRRDQRLEWTSRRSIFEKKEKVRKKRRRKKNPRCWGKKYLVSHALSLSFFYALKIGCASTPLDCFKNERALFSLSPAPLLSRIARSLVAVSKSGTVSRYRSSLIPPFNERYRTELFSRSTNIREVNTPGHVVRCKQADAIAREILNFIRLSMCS